MESLAEYLQTVYGQIGVAHLTCLDKNVCRCNDLQEFDICRAGLLRILGSPQFSEKLFYPYADRDYALVWTDEDYFHDRWCSAVSG